MLCLPAFTPVANEAHAVGDSGECVVPSGADAAAARRQLLHVRQLALVHPLLDQARIHAVEAEDHQLLLKFLRRPARSARGRERSGRRQARRAGCVSRCVGREEIIPSGLVTGRILAVDVGARRVGLAISDASRTLARPLETIAVASEADAVERGRAPHRGARPGRRGHRRRSSSACRRSLDGTPTPQTAQVQAFIAALKTRTPLPIATEDERLTSREAESRLARREKDWRKRKAQLDAVAAVGVPAGLSGPIADPEPDEEALGSRAAAVWSCRRRRAGAACIGASTSRIAATRERNSSSRSRKAPAASAIGERLVAAGVVRDTATFRTALWMSHQGRHLKAGEYRFDRAMTPFEVIDKIARGDVFVITRHVSRRADHRRDGEDLRGAWARHRGVVRAGGEGSRRRFTSSIRRRKDLEGYLFPETYALPRHTDAPKLIADDGGALREGADAGAARRRPRRAA